MGVILQVWIPLMFHHSLTDVKLLNFATFYKLVYELTDCQNVPVVQIPFSHSRHRNPIQLQHVATHSSQFQYSFYPHTIWNNLSLNNDSN